MQQLSPGANTTLLGAAVEVALSWRVVPGVDADVSALLCSGRRVRSDDDFVFFNQPRDPSGAVAHLGKSVSDGLVRDVLTVDLGALPADVDLVVVAASLDASGARGFGVLAADGLELAVGTAAVVPLSHLTTQTALVVAEFYRRGTEWKVRAVAQGYDDGLAGLARDFGVTVDEDPAQGVPGPTWDWRDPPVPAGYGG